MPFFDRTASVPLSMLLLAAMMGSEAIAVDAALIRQREEALRAAERGVEQAVQAYRACVARVGDAVFAREMKPNHYPSNIGTLTSAAQQRECRQGPAGAASKRAHDQRDRAQAELRQAMAGQGATAPSGNSATPPRNGVSTLPVASKPSGSNTGQRTLVDAQGKSCVTFIPEGAKRQKGTDNREFIRYDYRIGNTSGHGVTLVLTASDGETFEAPAADGGRGWFCTEGFAGNRDCVGGIARWQAR